MALDIKKFFQGLKLLNKTSPSNGVTLKVDDSYNVSMELEFPATGGTTGQQAVTTAATQTLTNKTIDGDNNTVQDLALSSLKTVAGDANKIIARDGSGSVVSSGHSLPSGVIVGTTDTQSLTNKTIDADQNTITNIENADIKTGAAIDAAKIADGSVSNSEFQNLNGVTSAIQTQIDGKVAKTGDTMTGALTLNADPTSALHAATKQYVDSISAGLDPKEAVAVATTSDLGGLYATTPSNGRITGGATVVDGVTLTAGDRVLVKDQLDPKQNGIYTYDGSGQYTRSSDMDGSPAAEVSSGNYSFATSGSTNIGKGFTLTGNGILTLNTDNITWTQFSGASNAALRDLSNLTTTAINQSLTPDTDLVHTLGSSTNRWGSVYALMAKDTTTADSIDFENRRLKSGSTVKLNWAGTDVSLNTRKLTDVSDPTVDQDAATKAYVDNNILPNFISNGRGISTTGWSTYADVAGASPVDGTGGAPASTTITTTSTNPLSGVSSLLLNKTATTNNRGEGWSYNFTIDNASKAKVLKVEFDYILNSGTFVAGDSLTDSTVTVWLYDITNSRLIQPSTYKLYSNSTTTAEHFSSTFQTSPDSTSYRLIIHQGTAATPQFVLKIDNVSVSPSQYVYGTPITDWVSYTPTGSWTTNTTYTGKWRRVGDSIEVNTLVTLSGAPNNTSLTINHPNGLTSDSTKMVQGTVGSVAGDAEAFHAGSGYAFQVAYIGSNSYVFVLYASATAGLPQPQLTSTTPFTWVSGDQITINYRVPISGWSSSVQMSDSADTRIVAFSRSGTSTVSVGTSRTKITTLGTGIVDTHGAWDAANNQYVVPVSGIYKVAVSVNGTISTTNARLLVGFMLNGSGQNDIGDAPVQGTGGPYGLVSNGSMNISLKAGDTIYLYALVASGTANCGNFGTTSLSIERMCGPSAIAANETIAAAYIRTTTQSIATGTDVTVIYDNKLVDTHNTMNTANGRYSCPIAGIYKISASVFWTASTASGIKQLRFMRRNSGGSILNDFYKDNYTRESANNIEIALRGDQIVQCNAGDTLEVILLQNSGGSLTTIAGINFFNVEKL